jgi:cell division protein FtsN
MPKARKNTRKKTPLPKSVWILLGLVIGITSTFFYKEYAGLIPSLNISKKVISKINKDHQSIKSTEPGEQKFDFYTLLPELEVIVPDDRPTKRKKAKTKLKGLEKYMLQAGTFKIEKHAESRKANMALLGVETNIQKVKLNDENWYRVQVGPYDDMEKVNEVRSLLNENNIKTMLTRKKK